MNEVELKLTANIDEATKDVARFSKEYQQMARAVERPLRQVNSFRDLQETLQGTQRELKTMRERVRELGGELARTANPSKQLQNEYRAAASELGKLERTEGVLTNQIARRRVELKAAGVDTRNLAAEQNRLAAALKSALSAGRAVMRAARWAWVRLRTRSVSWSSCGVSISLSLKMGIFPLPSVPRQSPTIAKQLVYHSPSCAFFGRQRVALE